MMGNVVGICLGISGWFGLGAGGGGGWHYYQNGMAFITYYTIVIRRNPQEIE